VASFALLVCLGLGCDQDLHLFEGILDGGQQRGTPRPDAPSVLLITLDTTRADALGAYGQTLDATPALDQLAKEGLIFEHCVSAAPDTLASHTTLLTGQLPFAHGVLSRHSPSLAEDRRTLTETIYQAGYATAAEIAAPVLGRMAGLSRGFELYRDIHSPDIDWLRLSSDESPIGSDLVLHERGAEQITERGIEFLAEHRTTPFFLWLNYFDPHFFYNAPLRYRALQPESPYHAELMYVDAQVQRIIEALQRFELEEETLVVVVGDHGEGLGQHGEETHGLFLHESTTRVPLILWGPDSIPAGTRLHPVVRTADVAPTILDFLDLPPLADAQGASLLPLIAGEVDDLSLTAYGEAQARQFYFDASPLRFVRKGRWKYIHGPDPALFDLEVDPGEEHDMALQRPELAAELQAELIQMLSGARALDPRAGQTVDRETWGRLHDLGTVSGPEPLWFTEDTDPLATRGPNTDTLRRDYARVLSAENDTRTGNFAAAVTTYRELLARYPRSTPILVGLINSLVEPQHEDDVIELLWRLLSLDPGHLTAQTELARLLTLRGDPEGLERVLRISIIVDPCAHVATGALYSVLNARGAYAEAVSLLREAMDTCEPSDLLLNNYAWALATAPDATLRDGLKAVDIAKRVASKSHPPNPAYLDTLAAAYAEVELFETAIKVQLQAIAILEQAGAPEAGIEIFRKHLELFEANSPIREE
jgi:arylsulfatase A-like enzyme